MTQSKSKLGTVYLVIVFILMYLPIFYLILFAFNKGDYMSQFTGFSLQHFRDMFSDARLMSILVNTFIIALLSSLIATLIGTFGALGIYGVRPSYAK